MRAYQRELLFLPRRFDRIAEPKMQFVKVGERAILPGVVRNPRGVFKNRSDKFDKAAPGLSV